MNTFAKLTLVLLFAFPGSQVLTARVVDHSILPNSPIYEAAATALRSAPSGEYKFSSARLSDVLQFLADEAGMSFFSLPNDSEAGQRIVTFTIHSSPFLALETLAKANGIALIYENGVWYIRPENDTQLIGRVYQIQYNSREPITSQASGGNLGSTSSGGGTSTSTSGVDLQGTTQSFKVETSRLLEDIKELLDIPTGNTPILAGVTTVDALATGRGSASSLLLPTQLGRGGGGNSENDSTNSAKVIWNSDANTLYIVATRQQHSWIEGYLAASDKPQDQIAIEVKFFEMNRDPAVEFGMDWSGTLAGGYNIDITGPDGSGITSAFNPARPGDFQLPMTAIVNFEDINLKLRALAENSSTKSVSYPRMVTTNNREVVFRSVVNQPVLAGSSSASLGAGATTTQSISYLPIGTVLNILPKRLGNGKIQLNIALTMSRIIGQQNIGGNPYPVASSRVYNAPVEVDEGYTVAIGGLDEANWSDQETGIPGLRKLPVLGYAFKSRSARRDRQSLMIMITPAVIDTRKGGLPDEPVSTQRVTPHDPARPVIHGDGTLVENLDGLEDSLTRLRHETNELESAVLQMEVEQEHKDRLFALYTSVRNTRGKLKSWSSNYPDFARQINAYDHEFALLQQRIERIQRRARWMLY